MINYEKKLQVIESHIRNEDYISAGSHAEGELVGFFMAENIFKHAEIFLELSID